MSRSLLKRLETMAPAIAWTTPIPVKITGTQKVGFLCRICVAIGIAEDSVMTGMDRFFADEEACLKHIEGAHVGGPRA